MAIETLGAALRQIKRLMADGTITGFPDAQLLERFVSGHDAAAFEVLVAHHGPMVLSVCRGILKDPNDAEDAFQATFLILVKKSATLRRHEALGPWLYQVAHRVAIRANAGAARRRECERRARQMAATTSTPGPAGPDEPLQALHEEITRLPERFRRPLVLCELQRVPQARAALELRISERTLQRRLNEGRKRLKARLIRRGHSPDGGMLAAVFLREARLTVPAAWGEMTVRAALAAANPSLTVGVVSAGARQLTLEVLRLMLLQKLTLASATLLAAGLIAWGASAAVVSFQQKATQNVASRPNPAPQRTAEIAVAPPRPDPLESPGKIAFRGRVLAPDGRHVPGAKLYMTLAWGYPHEPSPSPEYATSGPDGRFQFAVPAAEFKDQFTVVAAAAPDFGVGWVNVSPDDHRDELTIRLADDDVPITGQIIDLEGKPIAGATLRLMQVNAAPGEDLGPWLEAVKGKKGPRLDLEQQYLKRFTLAVPLQVTTDSAGRFRLTGIGRNRLVTAQLDGPTITSEHLHMLTRPGKPIELTDDGRVTTYYGAGFRHAAAPTRPIAGVVRDKDTGRPLAGFTIRSLTLTISPNSFESFDLVRTTTDAQGRYRLTGMPRRAGNRIVAVPDRDQPYVPTHKDIPNTPGLGPVTADIELKRAAWIEGKITDKVTGKPVQGQVEYFAFYSNPNLSDYDGFAASIFFNLVPTQSDGAYRVAGLPGPGLLAVFHKDDYLSAPERDDEYGIEGVSLNGTAPWAISHPVNYSALARIDPAKGAESVKRDVTLDPGWTFTGTVLGPDGKPLNGVKGFGLTVRENTNTAQFTVRAFNPRRPRDLFLKHPGTGLVGVVPHPKSNGGSVTVQMEPGAVVTGRLVDANGQPRADVELSVSYRMKLGAHRWAYSRGPVKTDQNGRFRIDALLPGYEFILDDDRGELPFGDGLRSGQTKDLGDAQLKKPE